MLATSTVDNHQMELKESDSTQVVDSIETFEIRQDALINFTEDTANQAQLASPQWSDISEDNDVEKKHKAAITIQV
jgi:hypothetical protein